MRVCYAATAMLALSSAGIFAQQPLPIYPEFNQQGYSYSGQPIAGTPNAQTYPSLPAPTANVRPSASATQWNSSGQINRYRTASNPQANQQVVRSPYRSAAQYNATRTAQNYQNTTAPHEGVLHAPGSNTREAYQNQPQQSSYAAEPYDQPNSPSDQTNGQTQQQWYSAPALTRDSGPPPPPRPQEQPRTQYQERPTQEHITQQRHYQEQSNVRTYAPSSGGSNVRSERPGLPIIETIPEDDWESTAGPLIMDPAALVEESPATKTSIVETTVEEKEPIWIRVPATVNRWVHPAACERSTCLTRIPKMFGGGIQSGTLAFAGNVTGAISGPFFGNGPLNIAENSSPVPTTRAFFTYQRFYDGISTNLTSGAETIAASNNLDIYTPGIEKTFLGGRASFEVRAPMVVTDLPGSFPLNGTTIGASTGTLSTINGVLKGVIWENNWLLFSGGVGMRFVPGIDTAEIRFDQEIFTYEQSGVDFAPFLGFSGAFWWDTFAQGMVQYNIPTDDDVIKTVAGGTEFSTSIRRQQSLSATVSGGKWLLNRPGCWFSGLAVIGEANYAMAVGDNQTATLTPGAGITSTQIFFNRYDTLVSGGGVSLELFDRVSARCAAAVPVLLGENKFHDVELNASVNWRF